MTEDHVSATTRLLDPDPPPIRLGRFTSRGLPKRWVAAAALGCGIVPASLGAWYAITGRYALAVLNIAVGAALTVIWAVALMVIRRMDAGGSVDASGVRAGRRRLVWSEVSRISLLRGGGRELLAVCPNGSAELLFVGSTADATIDRDEVLRWVQEWSGLSIETPET